MSPPLLPDIFMPPLDLELEGGILPDDGVRLVGAEQHVGGLARGPRQASTEPVRCPFLREEK